MIKQEIAILFSGSIDTLALYALATIGKHPDIPAPRMIHLLCMHNGAMRFAKFPLERFEMAKKILKAQIPSTEPVPEGSFVELDVAGLLKGLWIDAQEVLMPQYNGKNLVCTGCGLAMHTRALIYCVEQLVPLFVSGHSGPKSYCPPYTEAFMTRITAFSAGFGITTRFPMRSDFDDNAVVKHLLTDYGLPADDGGEGGCLFSQSRTTVDEKEIERYLDQMIPRLTQYVENRLAGKIRDAAGCFT